MSYRGLILDFGGVVTTDFYGGLSAFCVREGLGADAFVQAIRTSAEGRAALKAVERGELPQREFERVLGRLLGVDDTGLLARALADIQPRPEIIDLAARARAAGIRVAILSNSLGSGDHDPYAGYDLDTRFDAVVISDRVGLRKPGPEIYQLAASLIGLPPGECLFVDDTERNLPPARDLGMGTLLFTGAAEEISEIERLTGLTPLPTHVAG
jgi:epoxide hydrolase-like predicted phosphatase